MSQVEAAVAAFEQGFSCSQAVFSAYAEQFGLDRQTALKLASAFGGGMGRRGDTCGAVAGAMMVLGLRYGTAKADDRQAKEETYRRVGELAGRFKAARGSIVCRELLGCDISSPEGLKRAQEQSLFKTTCPGLVRDAARILEALLH